MSGTGTGSPRKGNPPTPLALPTKSLGAMTSPTFTPQPRRGSLLSNMSRSPERPELDEQSPAGSPTGSPGPNTPRTTSVLLGEASQSMNWTTVAHPEHLSIFEFSMHNNMSELGARLDALTSAVVALSSGAKYVAKQNKLEMSEEDQIHADKLNEEHLDLLRVMLKALNDLQPERLTDKAGKKLDTQAAAFKVLFEQEVQGASEALIAQQPAAAEHINAMTADGYILFYKTLVKDNVKVSTAKTAPSSAAKGDDATIKLLAGQDHIGLINDQMKLYAEKIGPTTKPSTRRGGPAKEQSKAFKLQIEEMFADDEKDHPILSLLASLTEPGLETWYIECAKKSKGQPASAAGNKRNRNDDDGFLDDADADDDDEVNKRRGKRTSRR
ncbi:unnamed protein product [Zymoseptoria tritici ST99CH_1A5]|uniref:Uncharacterized protein n=1 Tax=Zymoseptoria tritici ST99CH_1A5 TaxID=1276529 RepID=A0A1Y6LRD7_ZYMTR|nr:unnamed protein product [Zymoseptoria tritici ST99CH_1A5]